MKVDIRAARSLGIVISAATYIVALVAAVVVVRAAGLGHPLADLALGTLVATVIVFAVSVATNNSSIYDPYWSVQPIVIAANYLWIDRGHVDARLIVATTLLGLYALRLTGNFYRDWPGLRKEDFRYRSLRARFGRAYWPVSFAGIHLFPTIMVYLGCLPLFAIGHAGTNGFGWLDVVGAVVLVAAVVLAFVADEQLRSFRNDSANRGKVICGGLWGRSRHPNYLGEITTWWGLWLMGLAAGVEWWWTVAGAVAITLMFVFVSVPMMERRLLATRAGYQEYRTWTPMLLPRLRSAFPAGQLPVSEDDHA